MEFDQPNHFIYSEVESTGTVGPHELTWDAQDAAASDQNHITSPGQLDRTDYFQGLPDMDGGKLPSMSTSRAPMGGFGTRASNTAFQKSNPQNAARFTNISQLTTIGPSAAARLLQNRAAQRRHSGPTSNRRMTSSKIHPLQQEVVTLRWNVQEIEDKLEISRKTMEILKTKIKKLDPEMWMTVKEIVQELHDQETQQDLGMTTS